MSPLPHVRQVARPAAGDDEQSVDADIVAWAHEARSEPLGGYRNAAQALAVEREGCGLSAGARLDLDERKGAPAPRDQVYFAAGHARAPGEDAPAVQAKVKGRELLGPAPALFGFPAVHADRSRARA